jgi:hypothetical protein
VNSKRPPHEELSTQLIVIMCTQVTEACRM